MEASVLIPSGSDTLYGMLYRPAGPALCGVLMCNQLFEERKGAQRVMVDAARALAAAGCAVLRFDYRGCGDSSGDFADFSCEDWRSDIAVAGRFLKDNTGVERMGRLGVRLGASLMLESSEAGDAVDFCVLWAPVLNGRQYFDQELRRKLVKEMVTFGQSRATRATLLKELKDGKGIDLDGYAVTPTLFEEISGIDLLAPSRPLSYRKTLLVQIAPSEAASRDMICFQERLGNAGAAVDFLGVSEDPFWNLVGLVECPSLVSKTSRWIMELT